MIIYVAGKFSAPTQEGIDANVVVANRVGKDILAAKHTPVVPHNLSYGWEQDDRFHHDPADVKTSDFLRMDFDLIWMSDALFMLPGWEDSPGARAEHKLALVIGLPIYTSMEDVPDA